MIVSPSEICRLVGLQLGINEVKGNDLILEELGAASIDIINIVATVEERFEIEIAEDALAGIRRVSDLHQLVQQLAAANTRHVRS